MPEATTNEGDAAARLAAYLAFVEQQGRAHRRTKPTDSVLRRTAKRAVPVAMRGRARFVVTDLLTPLGRRKAERIVEEHPADTPFLLHIGSGGEPKQGWINVDLAGDPVEVAWNLKRGLPFPDGIADAIFSEHLLEHIPLAGVAQTVRECLRVLRPGGILRIGVPDAGAILDSYGDGGKGFIERTRPGRPTPMIAVQELFYWYGHCTMYDEETLTWLLRAAGFTSTISRREPGESALPVDAPDTERRWAETLYVETVRPD